MLKYYLLIMVRTLMRNRLFSFLNLAGLSIGMASSLIILLWVQDELKTDAFHGDVYQIKKINFYADGEITVDKSLPGPLVAALREKYPEIQEITHFHYGGKPLLQVGDKGFLETAYYVDPDFFNLFNFPLIQGEKSAVLAKPTDMVITERLADKLFPKEEALGKSVTLSGIGERTITGVLANLPPQSSLQFDVLLQYADYEAGHEWIRTWGNQSPQTFLTLQQGADLEDFSKKIYDEQDRHDAGAHLKYTLQPFADTYLYSEFKDGKPTGGGRIQYVKLFASVAFIIILIACINFMNLTTAQASRRAREVGVRKVVGAQKGELIRQFVRESMVFTLAAFFIAALLVVLLMPLFNTITEKQISLTSFGTETVVAIILFIALTGLLASSYPALYLSGLKPVSILKGFFKAGSGVHTVRKVLVMIQFALSVGMIVCTLVISRQMDFIRMRSQGINRSGLICMPLRGNLYEHTDEVRQQLLTNSFIEKVGFSSNSPLALQNWTTNISWPGKNEQEDTRFYYLWADKDFISTTDLQLVDGRNFSAGEEGDTTNLIFNEAAVRAMGLENPIGQRVRWWNHDGTIIGVVKDFNFQSVHEKVEPLVMMPAVKSTKPNLRTLTVRTTMGQIQPTLEAMEKVQKQLAPEFPFEYQFVSDQWEAWHKSEQKVGMLFYFFAGLSIAISCLGLFGLAVFAAEQRRKEIGIRKALGASVQQISILLSTEFSRLILIGAVPGCLVSLFYMSRWLQGFAYRVELDVSVFLIAIGSAFAIAIFTVSYQAIKAAVENPVSSLKQE